MGAYLSSPVVTKETFDGSGLNLRYGGGAMQGWRKTMEDAHIAVTELNNDPNSCLFAVFDGHGGGEVAKFCQRYMPNEIQQLEEYKKGLLEDSLIQVFHRMDIMLRDAKFSQELQQLKTKETVEDDDTDNQADGSSMDPFEMLKRVLQLKRYLPGEGASAEERADGTAPMEASQSSEQPAEQVQAGCTAVVALKTGNDLYVANAGDSRGVLCRGGQAIALSEDHKPAQQIERDRIIRAGGFVSDIGGVTRVNGNLNLSRAIGDLKYKGNTSLPPKDQIISAHPDVKKVTLTPKDQFFVLACDGVWDVMTNQQVVDFVKERLDKGMVPKEISCELLDACLATDPKEARGIGCDNMTIVIVQLDAL
jgi:protein phosphatase 1G